MKPVSSNNLEAAIVPHTATIEETVAHMSNEAALVVDDNGRLCGLVTDGDLRRAFLDGARLDTAISKVMTRSPLTAKSTMHRKLIRAVMIDNQIRHLPVIDEDGRPLSLELLKDHMFDHSDDNAEAVLMAGGLGTRLRPLTLDTPKPLLNFGESTIVDTILDKLHDNGISDVVLSVNYKADQIKNHLGDGESHELSISYVQEDKRMGTAGSLTMIEPKPRKSFLLMNADLITELDFQAFKNYHRNNNNDITVCVRRHRVKIPYGVIQLNDDKKVKNLVEKPDHEFLVNAGIYMLEPKVIDLIPRESYYDMTSLIEKAVAQNYSVGAFPILEYWSDIGQHHEMECAKAEWKRRQDNKGSKNTVPAFIF